MLSQNTKPGCDLHNLQFGYDSHNMQFSYDSQINLPRDY